MREINDPKALTTFTQDYYRSTWGLKSDEHEVPWGDGAFNNAWVTNPSLQEDFRPWANALLYAIHLLQ